MNCNLEIHNEMITTDYIECPFCDQQLQLPSINNDSCCDKQDVIDNNGTNVCQSCGTVDSYCIAKEYIDFHKHKYKIVKKSIYDREYHLENFAIEK